MNGLELKQWRKNAGISAKELASKSGVTASTISRFENGSGCSNRNYQKLLDVVNGVVVTEKTEGSLAKIKFHIEQIELLIESEGS
jgi:transcriptional regulator with XRE-family HTH domain